MEKNPYEYNSTLPWLPQQNQYYEDRSPMQQVDHQHLIRPMNQAMHQHKKAQKPRAPEKMSRARAQALAGTLKRWFAAVSIVTFGMFGGLVALHQVDTTSNQSMQSSSGSSKTNSTSSSSSQNNSSFLNQQGGNTGGTSSSSTSSSSQGFNSGSTTASSTPVTGTSTS